MTLCVARTVSSVSARELPANENSLLWLRETLSNTVVADLFSLVIRMETLVKADEFVSVLAEVGSPAELTRVV